MPGPYPNMEIGVRIKTGVAWLYHKYTTPVELKKLGIRPATEEEKKKYWAQKPKFDTHQIQFIQLAEPVDNPGPKPATPEETDKWQAMIRSIHKAAKILNRDLTEKDMPEPLDWRAGSDLHDRLWAEVYALPKKKAGTSSNPEPTGTCYEDAWRFFIKQEEGVLIHGTVLSQGKRVGHAWVELPSGYIWEPQTSGFYTAKGFHTAAEPIEESRYTTEEASIMLARVGKHGPWTEEERTQWLHESSIEPAVTVDKWYNRHVRSWVVQKKDARGYQVGDAEYVGTNIEAEAIAKDWRKEIEGNKLTDDEGKAIAQKLGIRYLGIQEDERGKPWAYYFNDDDITGSSFVGASLANAEKRLKEIREAFKVGNSNFDIYQLATKNNISTAGGVEAVEARLKEKGLL